jgi:uncharacterized protein (DUF305 family)
MRTVTALVLVGLVAPPYASAEVTGVTIASRAVVAGGQSFGRTGPYEKLAGTIEFALDPSLPGNKAIVDLDLAPRDREGKVRFTSDLYVLRPVDASRGNGVLLFEIANRGRKGLLGRFNGAPASADPSSPADFGNGYLLEQGYTLVWVGWEFDVDPPLVRADLPRIDELRDVVRLTVLVNSETEETPLVDEPVGRPPIRYPPIGLTTAADTLSVRNRFWDQPTLIPRHQWRFVDAGSGPPRIRLDGGFEPGRIYEISYRASGARVAGAAFAAIRETASAMRYRPDFPIVGHHAIVFGASQSGRFLREFLYTGFNVDERGRRAFDAVWPHIAGAALGRFNVRFSTTTHGQPFLPTRFPFSDVEQQGFEGKRDGLTAIYGSDQRPKVFHTNTSVEYWGQGRAAALTHTTPDGSRDVSVPDDVRIYLLAGTQHGESAFPPSRTTGQQLNNPTPQGAVMRALLHALGRWTTENVPPPASRYPRLADGTLVPLGAFQFPTLPGVADPRTIEGPRRQSGNDTVPLAFLVPQVDEDGNELAGIRVPDVAVPLATATGWNFRAPGVGNSSAIYWLLGSYLPFAATPAERQQVGDPRRSVAERYRNREDYLQRIRSAAAELAKGGYLLDTDLPGVVERAEQHWAQRSADRASLPPIFQPGAPGQPGRVLSAAAAADLSGIAHTAADVRFMQDMIGHHAQALEMTALVPSHTARDDLRRLATRIEASQADEIKKMREWLEDRGQPAPDAHAHHAPGATLMPGMLTADEMARLTAAGGPEFDRLFLELMIRHHEGALVMAKALFANPGAGQESDIFAFASDVVGDQQIEIGRMRGLVGAR